MMRACQVGCGLWAPADRFPGLVRQSFIGQVDAGELGVAPFLGDLDGMEDGHLGRAFQILITLESKLHLV